MGSLEENITIEQLMQEVHKTQDELVQQNVENARLAKESQKTVDTLRKELDSVRSNTPGRRRNTGDIPTMMDLNSGDVSGASNKRIDIRSNDKKNKRRKPYDRPGQVNNVNNVDKANNAQSSVDRFQKQNADAYPDIAKYGFCVDIGFVADFSPELEPLATQELKEINSACQEAVWTTFYDGSSNQRGAGLGIVLKLPQGDMVVQSICCDFMATNNEAEYELLIASSTVASDLKAIGLNVCSDSLLVVSQLNGEFEVKDSKMTAYLEIAKRKAKQFNPFTIKQVPRDKNTQANAPANLSLTLRKSLFSTIPLVHLPKPSVDTSQNPNVITIDATPNWMTPIIRHLKDDVLPNDPLIARKLRFRIPFEIVCDNGSQFISDETRRFFEKWNIKLCTSTPRYPQDNGQAETTLRASTGQTPFSLVYGCKAVLPSKLRIPTAKYGLMTTYQNNIKLSVDLDTSEELREAACVRMAGQQ
uniref:Integrase catalytic domain-containing protein n=1 Tax=Chenopodium quinoa TaxID=63459 RepID=A0A803LW37_CHEQI